MPKLGLRVNNKLPKGVGMRITFIHENGKKTHEDIPEKLLLKCLEFKIKE